MSTPTDILLFESPPPLKVRAIAWLSVATLACCLPGSVFVFRHMTRNNFSPELAPLWSRVTMALVIASLGIGFFVGMLFYLKRYATRLIQVSGRDELRVETLRWFGREVRTLNAGQIASASYHRGPFSNPAGVSVDAPWYWVRVNGSRSFLLDAQGTFHRPDALARLLPAEAEVEAE